MRVVVTGGTGVIGRALVAALLDRGDEVTVLSRDGARAREMLGEVEAFDWLDPKAGSPPVDSLAGRDAVVNLLGENLAQRWNANVKQEIRDSRVLGTRNLVEGLRAADPRPGVLVSQSGADYYGTRGDEPVDESAPPGEGFLAQVCVGWEAEARAAEELGLRVTLTRSGVVLSPEGGALAKMLPFFKLGLGGPVAGGRQYMPWIHREDAVRVLLRCLDDDRASGPVNMCAPEPATNRELSKALGRVLRRPAIAPVPAIALKLLYGEMAQIVTTGRRMVPSRMLELGFEFRHPHLEDALRAAVVG